MVLRSFSVFFVSLADIGRKTKERKVTKLLLLPSRICSGWRLYPDYDVCDEELFSTLLVAYNRSANYFLLGCRLC